MPPSSDLPSRPAPRRRRPAAHGADAPPAAADAGAGAADDAAALRFTAELWRHRGDAAWHFVTVPAAVSESIRERRGPLRRGFGSVRVHATVEGHPFETSVFPDNASGCYVLPVKRSVRAAAEIEAGDHVPVVLLVGDD